MYRRAGWLIAPKTSCWRLGLASMPGVYVSKCLRVKRGGEPVRHGFSERARGAVAMIIVLFLFFIWWERFQELLP